MIDSKLSQFFVYEKDDAIINLLQAARFACAHAMNGDIVDNILDLTGIKLPAPLFVKHLDQLINQHNMKKNKPFYLSKMNRSPGFLQDSPITWLYYSLYWAFDLESDNLDLKEEHASEISKIVLSYHYYYVRYKNKEKIQFKDPDRFQGKSFFEETAQTLSRVVEYLSRITQVNSKYLNKLYFGSNTKDLGMHFLEIATTDIVESNHYFIMKNEIKKDENYLLYENDFEDIKLQIVPSRRIQSGGDNNSLRNRNIINFFKEGMITYKKLIGLEFKGSRGEGKGGGGNRYDRQYTEREELLNDSYVVSSSIPTEMLHEDVEEVLQKQRIKHRVIGEVDKEDIIPNRFKQQQMNRAFSANVTKRLLMLSSSYEVPPKEHLSEFIGFICEEPIGIEFKISDLFRTVFIFGTVTGFEYSRSIDLIFDGKKQTVLDLNEQTIAMELDSTLFAKEKKSPYLEKSSQKITYAIPPLLVMLIRKTKLNVEVAGDVYLAEMKSDIGIKSYKQYIEDKIKAFGRTIAVNPEQVWRIIETYKKESFKEDMSALFCIGKYQTNDRARLAYASTHKQGQVHATFIQQMFTDLDLDSSVSKLLGMPNGLFKVSVKTDHHKNYSGSSRAVSKDMSQQFFHRLKYLIRQEDDEIIRFNLIAVYTKYALSLLLGTRPFTHSTNLKHISFAMHVLNISEKASTLLSGVRVIPLCDRAEQIIRYYKRECAQLQIPDDHIYLIKKGKPSIYHKDLAPNILNDYNIEKGIIDFVNEVPVNTGRHVITKIAMETNFNGHYLRAFLGHYSSGEEQFGIFSTMNSKEYIQKCRELTQSVAMIYGVQVL